MSDERPFSKRAFGDVVRTLLDELRSGTGGRAALTDTTAGSVVRTLVEAFAREMAVCYEQLERVYEAGYLETASSGALDSVVALVGLTASVAAVSGAMLYAVFAADELAEELKKFEGVEGAKYRKICNF